MSFLFIEIFSEEILFLNVRHDESAIVEFQNQFSLWQFEMTFLEETNTFFKIALSMSLHMVTAIGQNETPMVGFYG